MANQEIELSTILSVLAILSTLTLGILQLVIRPKQSKAQDNLDFTSAAKAAVELAVKGFEERIKQLEMHVKDRDEKIKLLEDAVKERDDYIDRLIDQLVKAGIVPVDRKRKQRKDEIIPIEKNKKRKLRK